MSTDKWKWLESNKQEAYVFKTPVTSNESGSCEGGGGGGDGEKKWLNLKDLKWLLVP